MKDEPSADGVPLTAIGGESGKRQSYVCRKSPDVSGADPRVRNPSGRGVLQTHEELLICSDVPWLPPLRRLGTAYEAGSFCGVDALAADLAKCLAENLTTFGS